MAHNPEVAGSNPAPATSFRRSRPFPITERAFCVPGTVVRLVVAAGFRAAWRRDGGDGVTRDGTAWTWWTLPPAPSGRLAQRTHPGAHRSHRVGAERAGTRVAARRVGPGSPDVCRGMWQPEARGAALARVERQHLGHRSADAGRSSHAIAQCSQLEPCQPARVTAVRHAVPVVLCAADQDAVDYASARRWSETDTKTGWSPRARAAAAVRVSGRSAADFRLRFAGGVLVPFLRCRWSHVGAKRRVGMSE